MTSRERRQRECPLEQLLKETENFYLQAEASTCTCYSNPDCCCAFCLFCYKADQSLTVLIDRISRGLKEV